MNEESENLNLKRLDMYNSFSHANKHALFLSLVRINSIKCVSEVAWIQGLLQINSITRMFLSNVPYYPLKQDKSR